MEIAFENDGYHESEALLQHSGARATDCGVQLEPQAFPVALELLRRGARRGWIVGVEQVGLPGVRDGELLWAGPGAVRLQPVDDDGRWVDEPPFDVRPGSIKRILIY